METTHPTPVNPLPELSSRLSGCGRRHRHRGGATLAVIAAVVVAFAAVMPLCAQTSIPVPNGSFELPEIESPEILPATAQIDSWQKTSEPPGYDTNIFGSWDQKTGVFFNTNSLAGPPIDNVDGLQAAFLFTYPGVGLFQDYDSVGGTNSTPSNEFDATFTTGKSYRLSVGLTTSSSYRLVEGSTLKMILYYRDGASNRVSVAENTVTYSTNVFTDPFHLLTYPVSVPKVVGGEAWAGQHIGIEFVSTTDISIASGIWDLDDVRLVEFISPTLTDPVYAAGQFEFNLLSDPGAELEVLTSTNVSLALSNWISLGVITNTAGLTNYQSAAAWADQRFYAVRQLP